jgi:hypothetical protein
MVVAIADTIFRKIKEAEGLRRRHHFGRPFRRRALG